MPWPLASEGGSLPVMIGGVAASDTFVDNLDAVTICLMATYWFCKYAL